MLHDDGRLCVEAGSVQYMQQMKDFAYKLYLNIT